MSHEQREDPHVFVAEWDEGTASESRRALRAALSGRLSESEAPAEELLRRAVHAVCQDAHQESLRAEQVVLIVKQLWFTIPEVRQLPRQGDGHRLLRHAITLCIDEFYEAPQP